jgi:DNA-directed RNA polymerase I, II, and III subunit RPABC2
MDLAKQLFTSDTQEKSEEVSADSDDDYGYDDSETNKTHEGDVLGVEETKVNVLDEEDTDDSDEETQQSESDDYSVYDNEQQVISSDDEETSDNESSSDGDETDETDESDEEEDDDYLQKFDKDVRENFLVEFHPEARAHNDNEVRMFSKVIRNKDGQIIDDLHRTLPFLTKYEYTRVIGQRSKQIESGAKPFVSIASNIIDGDVIARMELEEKKLPFIIRRPMPGGGFEYWKLEDLELLR